MTLDAPALVAETRAVFDRGTTLPLVWRLRQLEAMRAMLREREDEFAAALHADLGKSRDEAFTTEIGFTIAELGHLIRHLRDWLRPKRAPVSLALTPATSYTMLEPLGVVLVIAPWNYPAQLTLAPLAGALAAGNAAIVKPSELAPATSAALARLLPQYLDAGAVRVVEGGPDETGALLAERFDHIFFTGGERVGRIVARAAAEHLTPITLELGGKSPVFVDEGVDLDTVANRIAWGKFLNAGQTCIAPDYLLATPAVADALEARIREALRTFFGPDARASVDYGRIVNDAHFARLRGALANGPDGLGEGRIVLGGDAEASERYLAPTLVRDPGVDSTLMRDEIFGPILPIVTVDGPADAIAFIRARPKPLALYVFTSDRAVERAFATQTSSGSLGINLTVAQTASPSLPFGGVGASGMGAYHGEDSVRTFSHRKPVTRKPLWPDTLAMTYPPIGERTRGVLRRLLG